MTDLVGLPGAKAPTAAAQGRSSCPVCGESEPSPPRCRRCHRRLLPPADSRTALRLTEVSKRYGRGETAVNAVTGLSLEVARGEMTLLAGPSGSGKTTALLLMGLLLRPDSGTVTLAGTQATALPQAHLPTLRLLSIGFVFQQFNLIASLSAAENVELPLRMAGVRPHFVRRRSLRLLYELELGGRSAHRPAELSGGQKQRVAIARALAVGPDVILADEPTANLDSVSGHTVMAQLAQLAGTNNTGVLIVTHDTRYVDVVHRVLRLEDGRLVTDHTPSGRPSGGFR